MEQAPLVNVFSSIKTQKKTIESQDFHTIFDVLDEAVLVVHSITGKILWVSNTCKSINPIFETVTILGEIPELEQLVQRTLQNSESARVHAKWQTTDSLWDCDCSNNRKLAVSVHSSDEPADHVWIRLTQNTARDHYLKHYIAEREKLFNTSRSISVGEMATTLAHELNQPIGTMINMINGVHRRLQNGVFDKTEILAALSTAEKQGHFATNIVSRIRDFTHARKPKKTINNICELLEDTVILLDWVFESENVTVKQRITDTSISVYADKTLLQQVFVNLLRNSIEAMEDIRPIDKNILVDVHETEDGVLITITDSGSGLEDSNEKDLFTPFASKKMGGMGVGLNICRSFIELHQGRLWFTDNKSDPIFSSKEVKTGCTAHILLPNSYQNHYSI